MGKREVSPVRSTGKEGDQHHGGFRLLQLVFPAFPFPRVRYRPFDRAEVDRWLPVDLYVGGAEHAVMHLIYARFWTKVMFDAGMVGFTEPFACLKNQGMLLSYDHQKMSKARTMS